jgi:hypothetical protein
MAHGGIDVHQNQSPNVETVTQVVGHVYPVGSKYVHLTFHRRFQRHPHTDQWFEESAVKSNRPLCGRYRVARVP